MPLAWNVNAVWRNHLLAGLFVLFFCPWPFLTIFILALLALPVSEWDEEFIGTSFDETLEYYLEMWGFKATRVSDILKDHDKFLRIQLELGRRPQDKVDFDNEMEYLHAHPPSSGVSGYTQYNKWDEPFDGLAKEEFDWVLEIIEIAKEEWVQEVQAFAYLNDLGPDAVDVWAYRYLGESFTRVEAGLSYSFPFASPIYPREVREAKDVLSTPFVLPSTPSAWQSHLYVWQEGAPILNTEQVKVMIDDVGRYKFRHFITRRERFFRAYLRWEEETLRKRDMARAGTRSWKNIPYVPERRRISIWESSLKPLKRPNPKTARGRRRLLRRTGYHARRKVHTPLTDAKAKATSSW